jgi:hypothetical protein
MIFILLPTYDAGGAKARALAKASEKETERMSAHTPMAAGVVSFSVVDAAKFPVPCTLLF